MSKLYTKHYYIESDRIVSKIGGGMELNIVPLDTCMYAFDIEDIDDYQDKSDANLTMMYRHFDSTLVEDEVLVEAQFGWLNDCANYNETEKDIYYYHKDHLGSSTQITDKDAVVIHHIEYMPSGEQFLEQRNSWGTSYKFNNYGGESFSKAFDEHTARSAELDAETGLYYYGARYYNPTLSIWASVDPMSDKYPHQSNYMYCSGRPVNVIDPDGRDEWEVNESGKFIGRIENKKQDSFHIVGKNGKRIDGKSIVFEYGTVQNSITNVLSGGVDTKTLEKYTTTCDFYSIKGDQNALDLFTFMANNTDNVEWGLLGVGKNNGKNGLNVLSTGNYDSQDISSGYLASFIRDKKGDLRYHYHNHPNNTGPSGWINEWSEDGDIKFSFNLEKHYPNMKFYVYNKKGNKTIPYNSKYTGK